MNTTTARQRVTQFVPKALPIPMQAIDKIRSEESERAVIGAVLINPELYPSLSHLLQPTDFWTLWNGFMWKAIDSLSARGDGIDPVTLATELEQYSACPYHGDELMTHISAFYGACPNPESAETYARAVRNAALAFRVLDASDKIKAAVLKNELHGEGLKDIANRLIFDATEQNTEAKTDALAMMSAYLDSMDTERGKPIPTGQRNLDGILGGGVFPGEVTVLAGGEGMGKTTVLLSILRAQTLPSVAFSMEMTHQQIAQAFIAMETGIERMKLQSNRLNPNEIERVVSAAGVISQWQVQVVDMREFPALQPIQLRRKLRSLMIKNDIRLVVLDGLWLMQPDNTRGNRFEDVGVIMRDLSSIAKEFNVSIVVAHQYREEIRSAKRPTIYSLAESAGVRRNAEVIIGLWRRSFFDDSDDDMTYGYILKDRNRGSSGYVPLPFNRQFNRFEG